MVYLKRLPGIGVVGVVSVPGPPVVGEGGALEAGAVVVDVEEDVVTGAQALAPSLQHELAEVVRRAADVDNWKRSKNMEN